ncbi:uncharacterized protein LOC111230483 [Seriola dumerili]|uniref:uncharacterized protein LOC111230483 n=1 Tax=Seriola dumerili TaxID=41447 RepID=UPI000BBEE91A|nr:uncharacterized protein LOC111230483 [Seriola dumerili]
MDFRTVMTVSALLLITSDRKTAVSTTMKTPTLPQTTSNGTICLCHPATPAATTAPASKPSTSAPVLGFLTVRWTHGCDGNVILYRFSNSSLDVCYSYNAQRLLTNVCQNRKGCKDNVLWVRDNKVHSGYDVSEDGATQNRTSCNRLRVHCPKAEAIPDVNGQLQAYKVVAALLCCVLLILFLIRFTRPTVKALQKRLSDRRQNRWIGPTQSHSVSYHRGKTMVKNDDGEKRLSYPALERLTVSDSREPSSNRNSGYNF